MTKGHLTVEDGGAPKRRRADCGQGKHYKRARRSPMVFAITRTDGDATQQQWHDAVLDGVGILVSLKFTAEEVCDAVQWAREKQFTHERDGNLAALLFESMTSGVTDPTLEDTALL